MWYNTLMDHDQIQTVLHKVLGDDLKNDVSLRDYTTMRVGGASDFFYEAKVIDNLILALRACFEHDIPYIVLGSGSNVIFSDAGFPGLVVHNMTSNVSFIPEKSQVIVDSGTIYARLITEAASRGFGGIEYWFGLPGTIGGAVHNNAETWGHDMGEVVKQVTMMLPPADGKPERIEQVGIEWMQYRYRGSRLKSWHNGPKPIILTITLQLQQQQKEEVMRRMRELKQGRWALNQPKGAASSGSFFKNPGNHPTHDRDHTGEPTDSAGWLLEQVGAKKMKIGGAGVAKEHANFLINTGLASAADIRELASELKTKVKQQFDVSLEEEVQYLGVWSKKGLE